MMVSQSESSFVADKTIMGNFSDEFKNNIPDHSPKEEQSDLEQM